MLKFIEMKKTIIFLLILISASLQAQETAKNGYLKGFNDACNDEGLILDAPVIPTNNCDYTDYSCGYRLGVKVALREISQMSYQDKRFNRESKKYHDEYERNYKKALEQAELEAGIEKINTVIQEEYKKTINALDSGPQGYPMLQGQYTSLYIDGPSYLKYKRGPTYTAHVAPFGGNAFLTPESVNGCEKKIRWAWSHPDIAFFGEDFGVGDCSKFNGGEEDKKVTVKVSADRKTIIVSFLEEEGLPKLRLRHNN